MLGEIVTKVSAYGFPINEKLAFTGAVLDPIEAHIDGFGSRTAPGKASFLFIGNPAALTLVTTSPSTTLLSITVLCYQPTCTQLLSWKMQ